MASICDLNNQKVKIDYPTHWEYKVIFDASDEAEAKVKDIVKNREFKLVFSKYSKDKKYASYDLAVLVLSEEERLEIFSALRHEAKYVL
ncbi:HP0495 family protein [Campylobacter sp.]|uniref:HP0495 family protein n=1 Tax=Campylobacter sp. TaxID=205 RepID=UPI003FA16AAB